MSRDAINGVLRRTLAGLLDNFGRLFLGLEQGLDSVGLLGRLDGMSESYWDEDRSSIPLKRVSDAVQPPLPPNLNHDAQWLQISHTQQTPKSPSPTMN